MTKGVLGEERETGGSNYSEQYMIGKWIFTWMRSFVH